MHNVKIDTVKIDFAEKFTRDEYDLKVQDLERRFDFKTVKDNEFKHHKERVALVNGLKLIHWKNGTSYGLSVRGSFYKNRSSLEQLSIELNENLYDYPITRVDLCEDVTAVNVSEVLRNILIHKNWKFSTSRYENSVYFEQRAKSNYINACFYDKGLEMGKPEQKLLRFEIRFGSLFFNSEKAKNRRIKIATLNDVLEQYEKLTALFLEEMKGFIFMNEINIDELSFKESKAYLKIEKLGFNEAIQEIKAKYEQRVETLRQEMRRDFLRRKEAERRRYYRELKPFNDIKKKFQNAGLMAHFNEKKQVKK